MRFRAGNTKENRVRPLDSLGLFCTLQGSVQGTMGRGSSNAIAYKGLFSVHLCPGCFEIELSRIRELNESLDESIRVDSRA